MDSEIDSCISRGQRGSHSSAINLTPVGITKLEQVVLHKQIKGLKDHTSSAANREAKMVSLKEDREDLKGMASIDVGIHSGCVGSEQRISGRVYPKFLDLITKVKRT